MAGMPAIRLGREILKRAGIEKIEGILNGTTNFILTQMEAGSSYPEAITAAQRLGYTGSDPTSDLEGSDAAAKVVSATCCSASPPRWGDVQRTGTSHLTAADIREASQAGERWKLVGSLELQNGKVKAQVKPRRFPLTHPLAGIRGVANAIGCDTRLLGRVTLIRPGAGRKETGFAILSDLLAIHLAYPQKGVKSEQVPIKPSFC